MLEFVGVVVADRGVMRLDRCSFAVRPGEILGLVGPTGSGKTTALEVAAGLVAPARGRVLLDGRDATRRPARLREAAALLDGDRPAPTDLTVEAWLRLWAGLDGVAADERAPRIEAVLDRLGLRAVRARPVETLSCGEARRLTLARLWIRRPAIYLLDGPGDGLDGEGLAALSAAIREAASGGATVVLTAAGPYLPTTLCDRVLHLEGGAVRGEIVRGEPDFKARVARAQGWKT